MTATFTCEIPYAKEYIECFKRLRKTIDSQGHEALFLSYWLMPEETLLQHDAVDNDISAVHEMWDIAPLENFADNPAVHFVNDDVEEAARKALTRLSCIGNYGHGAFPVIVYRDRPGDVTPEGKEVRN